MKYITGVTIEEPKAGFEREAESLHYRCLEVIEKAGYSLVMVGEYQRLKEIEARYGWLRANVEEEVYQHPSEWVGVKTKYKLPLMTAYAEFCGQISFDDAVDVARGVYE